ncbi:MAG TPA: CbiX/SirB N-terminal domain-containing protein [Syntrophales bacterium]|nr:CbiX/SirB N-terminal domain-containing protein [Syntrophales bacterium]
MKKEAVILIGHGSRIPGAAEDMERVAAGMRERMGEGRIIEFCHMSMTGPFFPEVFDRCVAGGASKVVVIPYFLHMGAHILEDIPELLLAKAREYPGVEIIFGRNLGYDDCLVDLVIRRMNESWSLPDIRNTGRRKPA